MFNYLLGLAPK